MIGKRKRELQDIISELPKRETFDREYIPLPSLRRSPELQLPADIDITDPYALFSLFITNETIEEISDATNTYAHWKRQRLAEKFTQGRTWKDTNSAEIKVFLGIIIYMGIHKSPSLGDYWWANHEEGPVHSPQWFMTQGRFEQIKRFIHISDPDEEELHQQQKPKEWWYKVEPLASRFEAASRKYYLPGSDIAIDEVMIPCFGHSYDTVKMSNKPIGRGYKLFGLAEKGYLYSWAWSSWCHGIMPMFLHKNHGISRTGSMVVWLLDRLPKCPDLSVVHPGLGNELVQTAYSVYMDNYFNTIALLKYLHECGFGVCGTVQSNSGIPPLLLELKDHLKNIQWGTLYLSIQQGVLCQMWQDNNLVNIMTTIHSYDEYTLRM